MLKRSPTGKSDDLSFQTWSEKLRVLGATLDAQKAELKDLCILDLPEGFVVHANRRSTDEEPWVGVTFEFMLGDLASGKRSRREVGP